VTGRSATELCRNDAITLAGLLHGLPVAHKDLIDTAGVRTTYGSPLFAEHVPVHDELVVRRMAEAGAISLGKTNTLEPSSGPARTR
jgi:amidase